MAMVQFKIILSLFLGFYLIFPSIRATNVQYCDKKGDYAVKVTGVEISPYPVARGKPATFSISASTDEKVSDGKLALDVSYFGWHVHSETHDLCAETSCPATGDFIISHSQVLPGYTPPGSYTLKMRLVDGDKKQLTCISFDFSIGLASSLADS